MENMTKLRKRRAVSPVIATVILVAVTITVAVAVAYWMSGIASQYTSFEKVEIKSAYASRKYGTVETVTGVFQGWVIIIGVQNTGSSTSTLETPYVNNKPLSEYGAYTLDSKDKIRWTVTAPTDEDSSVWSDWNTAAGAGVTIVSLESGDMKTIYILIYGDKVTGAEDGLFSAGTTINIKFHSASGMDYIKLVQLT